MPDHRPAAPASPTPQAAGDPADRLRGRLMASSLSRVLDQVPGARDALPHLAALEQALGQRGAVAAVEAIPQRWRGRIGAQLASLPLPSNDPPLQDLQQRLCGDAAAAPMPGPAPSIPTASALPAATAADRMPALVGLDTLAAASAAQPHTTPVPPVQSVQPAQPVLPAPSPAAARPPPLSLSALRHGMAFDPESTVVVRELSHSEFMAISGETPGAGADSRL